VREGPVKLDYELERQFLFKNVLGDGIVSWDLSIIKDIIKGPLPCFALVSLRDLHSCNT
jgi:hypothetical protein